VKFAGAAIILAGVSMVRFGKDVEKGQAADSRRREAAV
jgi:hypothetical protein